jgi:hypothetical protein
MIAYDDTYSVLEDGTVLNTVRGTLKPTYVRGKYVAVVLHNRGHPTYYSGPLHRLMARLFLGEPPAGKCMVDHIDRNRMNNHISNLRWATPSENRKNQAVASEPTKKNLCGHLYISLITRVLSVAYQVRIRQNGAMRHVSTHDSLEEAIAKRDEVLASLNS